jgi:hypothetical protein
LGVSDLGFRVGVASFELRVWDLGFGVEGVRFRVESLGLRV